MNWLNSIVIYFLFIGSVLCQNNDDIQKQNEFGFQIINSGDKYTIGDSLGNVVIDELFDSISLKPFYSWEKTRNSFVCKKGSNDFLVSPKAQKIIKFDSILILRGGYYIGISNESYSLLDDDCNVGFEDYDYIIPLRSTYYGELLYKKNGKCGILDWDGKLITDLKVDTMIDIYSKRYIGIVISEKMGIYDYNSDNYSGKILIEPKYDYIIESHLHSEDEKKRFLTFDEGKFSIIDKHGAVLTKERYDCITTWVEHGPDGHYVCRNDKLGIINYNGTVVIPPVYDELFYCSSGLFKVVKKGKFGVLKSDKEVLIPLIYNSIIVDDYRINSAEGIFIYALMNDIWMKYDEKGNIITKNANDSEFIKNLAPFQVNHYGFEYVRALLIKPEDVSKF